MSSEVDAATPPSAEGPIASDDVPHRAPSGWLGELRGDIPGALALAVVLVAMLVFGSITAVEYPPWSPVDEGAHFHYVQAVAEKGRLPVLHELTSREVMEIDDRAHPDRPYKDASRRGLGGRSYEAFQPPLYYLVAAPIYGLASGPLGKVHALRLFGVFLMLLTFIPLALTARELAGPSWPTATAFAGLLLLLPGVLFRSAIVSNGALEAPLAAELVHRLVLAYRRDSWRQYRVAALVFGLCLLTKLTLAYLAVPVALVGAGLWAGRRDVAATGALLASVAIAFVPIAPWMARNLAVYGTPTANQQAKQMQQSIINPKSTPFTIADVWAQLPTTWRFQLPQESVGYAPGPLASGAGSLLVGGLLGVPLILGYRSFGRRRLLRTAALASAMPAGIALLGLVSMEQDVSFLLPRYLNAALPGFGLFSFLAYREALPWPAVRALVVGFLAANVALWIDLARAALL